MSIGTLCRSLLLSAASLGVLNAGTALAASGDIDRDDGVIFIMGDDWNDECEVYLEDGSVRVDLFVHDDEGQLDDHDDRSFNPDDIHLIVFWGYGGDDDFWNETSIPCIAYGDGGNDILVGGSADDELHGGSGDDQLGGRGGEDDLYGGLGSDYLFGGSENDYLHAGSGEDEWVIAGQAGEDTFATPAFFSSYLFRLVPINRDVAFYDFNENVDTQYLFWVVYGRTMFTAPYQGLR